MQLPRGKFRSVIKGVPLNSLIQELAEVRYTGVITITRNHELITLVIHGGRYTLAEYGFLRGDAAWEAITALGETSVDAILADFSEAGLKLANEFNEVCLISSSAGTRPVRPSREPGKEPVSRERLARQPPAPMVSPLASEIPAQPVPPLPEMREGPGQKAPGIGVKGVPPQAQFPAARHEGGKAALVDGYDELALLTMEMSALDDVDVEHIATKIRKNAKGIVKKLHLGHIMTEKEDEKGN